MTDDGVKVAEIKTTSWIGFNQLAEEKNVCQIMPGLKLTWNEGDAFSYALSNSYCS